MSQTIKPKTGNLKRLFILNGILLIFVIGILQYSLIQNEQNEHNDQQDQQTQNMIFEPILQGDFAQRLTIFDAPFLSSHIDFKTIFDQETSLDAFKGQWVILNLWATWCPPCLIEMPSLQALQDRYQDKDIKIIAISLDRNMTGTKLSDFTAKYNFGPVASYYGDWPSLKDKIEIKGLPTTYIISPYGKNVAVFQGHTNWVSDDAIAFVESMIAKNE